MWSQLDDGMPMRGSSKGRNRVWTWSVCLVIAAQGAVLAGCSDALPIVSNLPKLPVPDLLKPEKTVDQPGTPIELALSGCPKRTEKGETDCLKAALAAEHVTPRGLIGMMPGCSRGKLCTVDYTTVDRVGYVPATQSAFTVHWRATADFTKPATRIDDVPLKVVVV